MESSFENYESALYSLNEAVETASKNLEEKPEVNDVHHLFECQVTEALNSLCEAENRLDPDSKPAQEFYRECNQTLQDLEDTMEEAKQISEREFKHLEVAIQRYKVKLSEPRYIH